MKKVLIIDDAPEVASVVGATLRTHGFSALVALDGHSGISLARKELPDLIICDVHMPKFDGYETLKALRQDELTATTPFIFLSGMAERPDVRRGMLLGADDYLSKPFSPEELLSAVNTRLSKKDEQDRRTERLLQEFRGNISLALPHELRTPLVGILGLSRILIEEYATIQPAEILDTARYINTSALRLQRLVENFIIYAQIELLGEHTSQMRSEAAASLTATEETVTAVAQFIAKEARRETDLRCDIIPCLAPVIGENLKKIAEELVDNAFKFSAPGTPVGVRSEIENMAYTLTVADRGRGMSADQIASIGPHRQFDRRIYEQQGMGLGLIIAKRLTELQGGHFNVQSAPGSHTVVRASFPITVTSA